MDASAIKRFYAASTRAENDAANRAREQVLCCLNDLMVYGHYEADPEHGEHWKELRRGFEHACSRLLQMRGILTPFRSYKVVHKGGLSNNHDFLVTLFDEKGDQLLEFLFEFKFSTVPQEANHYDSERYIPTTLAEFWWDTGVVDAICGPYGDCLKYAKPPTREEYLKECRKALGSKSPPSFFKQFYDLDHAGKDERFRRRDAIVKAGIRTYLEKYGKEFDVAKLAKIMEEQRQSEKVYFVWKPIKKLFEIHEYSKEQTTPTEFLRVDNGNTVVLKAGSKEMRCLLRWKNTLGVCMPAWQIKIADPKKAAARS